MNKKLSLLLLTYFVLSSYTFIAQKKDKSVKLYENGNVAFARKDYRTADSLFTLSLNITPHPDSYYNRAVCRRQLNDFKGYCLDLESAAGLGDGEAKSLYWKQCAKADTVYKKNNGDLATKADGEIVEFIRNNQYNTDFEYEKKDTAGNVILSKVRVDNAVIYKRCKDVAGVRYIGGEDSLIQYIKKSTEFFKQQQEKNLSGYMLLSVITDETGKVKEVKMIDGEKDPAIDELLKGLVNMPNWTPAMYNDKPVKYQTDISVSYFDKDLSISSASFFNKDSILVEVMPDFPGGSREMMMFIAQNIVYPMSAKEKGLSGRCYLKFVVLPNGKIADVKILRGVKGCPECNAEAVKVISMMPKWKPGTQNGKAVPVFFTLPINFNLR